MGSFSNYWENKILNHIFGKSSYTPPAIYVGLSTADPLDNASGLAEPLVTVMPVLRQAPRTGTPLQQVSPSMQMRLSSQRQPEAGGW